MLRKTLFTGAAMLGVAFTTSVNAADFWGQNSNFQREQAHQRYLTPAEHQALHRGMGNGFNNGYNQPTLRYRNNDVYGNYGSYGGNGSYGVNSYYQNYTPAYRAPVQSYPYGTYQYSNPGYCF